MKIKKIGHCCLLIQIGGVRILTDPGKFSSSQNEEKDLDAVLITHEHGDHLHVESLKAVITNNPGLRVITNTSVGKILEKKEIVFEVVLHGESTKLGDVLIEGFGQKHHEIYKELGQVHNTGYFIGERFFYPGDAFTNPEKPVEVLAAPVAGPWCNVRLAVDYLLTIKPKKAFPVHDGMIVKGRFGSLHAIPKKKLEEIGGEFVVLGDGEEVEF